MRKRGDEYFYAGYVRDVNISENGVGAYVSGTEDYWCELLLLPNGGLDVNCECIYFDDWGYCKHLWALAREADQHLKRHPIQLIPLLKRIGAVSPLNEWAEQQLKKQPAPEPEWRRQMRAITSQLKHAAPSQGNLFPAAASTSAASTSADNMRPGFERRIAYVIDQQYDLNEHFQLSVRVQRREADGIWRAPKAAAELPSWYDSVDPVDVHLRNHLSAGFGMTLSGTVSSLRDLRLHPLAMPQVLKPACDAGRCYVRVRLGDHRVTSDDPILPLAWDADESFLRRVHVEKVADTYIVRLRTARGGQMLDDKIVGDRAGLYAITRERPPRVVRIEPLLTHTLRDAARSFPLILPEAHATAAIEQLLQLPALPPLSDDSQIPHARISLAPRPRLKLSVTAASDGIHGAVEFAYGDDAIISASSPTPIRAIDTDAGRALLTRDIAAEQAFLRRVTSAGASRKDYFGTGQYLVKRKAIPALVTALVIEGWHVEAEGKLCRTATAMQINVSSGIDWLDVNGGADFGDGAQASLPAILEAVRKRQTTVVLDDGTLGVLPQEWLKKYAPLANAAGTEADVTGDTARFSLRQSLLLDALLADLPQVNADEQFRAARERLAQFASIKPCDPLPTFVGELRPYQRDGLGWLQFLHHYDLGGCLADDMGLGKTIQVLALLDWRRSNQANGEPHAPSLIVVPRSLIFNWMAEAAKFAPKLRVLDHSVASRVRDVTDHLREYDVVLTTYGTLRTDAATFKDFEFDYVILDEAQAIKNATTASAKAARLLRCRHRLAMSGTPIENHLGELWSLFDFLNPGMFGSGGNFKLLAGADDADGRVTIARTIRPLLLRRTKSQVATDLPERVEQTIYCDLEPRQRKVYDQLREHYRALLSGAIASEGIEKSQFKILEALLRLRQAACHPALIDRKHDKHGSAKLDLLMTQIAEAIDEGHKVLVFSQFTSLLAILRERLDGEQTPYEYLDGQTRDRQARVERFQTDEACKLFLISLKAGGVGLNLTAADYVFLLDPWWNPAAEAQAIDRTHRIGQKRTVFATRLISRDTVEEKVLELQKSKRDLADAIVGEASRMSNAITREDLALLLA